MTQPEVGLPAPSNMEVAQAVLAQHRGGLHCPECDGKDAIRCKARIQWLGWLAGEIGGSTSGRPAPRPIRSTDGDQP